MNLSFPGVCVKYNHELQRLLWWKETVFPVNQKPYISLGGGSW